MAESSHSAVAALRRFRFPLIWLAPLFAILALGGWAFASPVGSSPDDDFHLASIWCAAGHRTSLCEPGATATTREVSKSLLEAPCFARDSTASGACQAAVFKRTTLVDSNRGNFAGQYPPLYYGTMSLLASNDIQASVIAMRLVNVALFVGIMTALTLMLPRRHRPTLLWSWMISVIPLGLFVIASINPSGWTVVGVGTAWIALLGAFDTVGRRRVGLSVVFVVSTLVAVGSRADAAIYVILTIAAVVFLRFRPDRRFLRQSILPVIGVVLAVAALLSSRQVTVALDGFPPASLPDPTATAAAVEQVAAPAASTLGLLFTNLANAPSLWAGVFGSWELGWFDTKMPFVVSLGGVGVFVAVVFVGLGVLSWRKLLISLGAIAALWLIPVWTLTRGNEQVGVDLQPRYLLPLIVVLAGFLLLRVKDRAWRLTRVQRYLVVVISIATQAVALFFTMRRFITGDDLNGFDLDQRAEWWWTGVPGPMFTWVLASLCWAAMMVVVVRYLERLPSEPRTEPVPVVAS